MSTDPSRPVRADARQNRERIVAAARAALTADGSASLTAIAKRAGVGIGTLYRHFPTREALVMELYRNDIGELIALAPRLLENHQPLAALRLWFDEVARYAALKYGVAEVIHAATNGGADDPAYEPFVGAIARLLDAGAQAGELKPDVNPEDVLFQLSVLWRLDPATDPDRPARILGLIVDGVRLAPQGR